jgi:hypothetical protein
MKRPATWLVALAIVALVVGVGTFFLINHKEEPTSVTQFTGQDHTINGEAAPVASSEMAASTRRLVGASNAYGWNWDHPVKVYDGTNNPKWRVADAAAVWDKASNLTVVMVSTAEEADIVVTEGDANAMCGTMEVIIGCGDTQVANGEPVHGTIIMTAGFGNGSYLDTLYGGTIHEFGHTFGFGHAPAPMTNADSVMGVPIPISCGGGCARTTLTQYDRMGLRQMY